MEYFPKFKLLEDYGFYQWLSIEGGKSHQDYEAKDIHDRLNNNPSVQPPSVNKGIFGGQKLYPISPLRLPEDSQSPSAGDCPPMVALHVAGARGLDLSSVDFVVRGKALKMLAERNEKSYKCKVVSIGSSLKETLMIKRQGTYWKNLNDKGMQFERLVTSRDRLATPEDAKKAMAEKSDGNAINHLRIIRLGAHKVLFVTEVDAIDRHDLVEIKAGKVIDWRGTMFQMLANGSQSLIRAKYNVNGEISGALRKSFKSIVEHYTPDELSLFQERIISGLDEIREQWELARSSSDARTSLSLSIDGRTKGIVLKNSFETFETVSQNLTDRFLMPYVNSPPDRRDKVEIKTSRKRGKVSPATTTHKDHSDLVNRGPNSKTKSETKRSHERQGIRRGAESKLRSDHLDINKNHESCNREDDFLDVVEEQILRANDQDILPTPSPIKLRSDQKGILRTKVMPTPTPARTMDPPGTNRNKNANFRTSRQEVQLLRRGLNEQPLLSTSSNYHRISEDEASDSRCCCVIL